MLSRISVLLAVALVVALGIPVCGQTYDYSNEFSTTTNPFGTWTCGSLDGSFAGFAAGTSCATGTLGSDYAFWIDAGRDNPSAGKVMGPAALEYPAGEGYEGAYLPAGGYLNSPNGGFKPTARWTSPNAARVSVSATFMGGLWTSTGSNSAVFVIKNQNSTTPLFSGQVDGFPGGGTYPAIGTGHTATYTGEVVVNPGDTIDFCAGDPGDRAFVRDQISFAASVTVLEIFSTPTLTGKVTDQATGNPIAGAKVKVVGSALEAVTDAQGNYTLQLVPETYSLEVSAAWYQTKTVTGVVVGASGATKDVALEATQTTRTSWNYATDYDYNTNPAPSVNFPVWTYGRLSPDFATFTIHSSQRFDGISWAWLLNDGIGTENAKMLMDFDNGTAYVPGGTACLQAGTDGQKAAARWSSPINGKVWVHAVFRGQSYGATTTADVHVVKNAGTAGVDEMFSDGIIGFVGGGGHEPIPDHATSGWWGLVPVTIGETIDFVVGDGGDVRDGDLVSVDGGFEVCQGAGIVQGTVRDASNQPLADAVVQVLGRSEFAITDASGFYSIGVPAGSYSLSVTVAEVGGDQKPVTVGIDQTVTLNFTLGLGTVQGVVKEGDSPYRPLMGAVVKVVGQSLQAVTDENGFYSLSMGAGEYSLVASIAEHDPITKSVTVTSNGTSTLNFDLPLISVWNYANEFSGKNPSGAWRYGALDSTLKVFTTATIWSSSSYAGTQYDFWQVGGGPVCGKIVGPIAMDYPAGSGYPGMYAPVGGYMNSVASAATSSAARWVSPLEGEVQINATFKGASWTDSGSDSTVWVVVNGNTDPVAFTAVVQGFPGGGTHPVIGTNHTATYSGQAAVKPGDRIDFVTGYHGTRTWWDQIAVDFTVSVITRVPTVAVGGTVTDSVTGLPIAGATVTLSGGSFNLTATTSAAGKYVLYVTPGVYTVAAGGLIEYTPQSYEVTVGETAVTRDFVLTKATTWSLAGDWTGANPNGAWRYGRYDFSVANFAVHTSSNPYLGATIWGTGSTIALYVPKNVPDIDDTYDFYPSGSVTFGPGADLSRSGARWTAPYDATLRVTTVWSGPTLQPAIGSSDVQVWKNAGTFTPEMLMFDVINGYAGGGGHPVTGTHPVSIWSAEVSVVKGDTLDFSAGWPAGATDRLETPARADIWISVPGSETTAAKLSDVKAMSDGQAVSITEAMVVTAASGTFADGACYIEDTDRVSGMKIMLATGLTVSRGDRVKLSGVLGTDANGERVLYVTAITSQVAGASIKPLGAPNRSIKSTVSGASLTGLLVTGWGRVTDKSADGLVVYVDDGSGVVGEGGKTGIKVVLNDTTWPTQLQLDDKIAVKGICAQNRVGGVTYPVILARDADDVTRP